MKVSNNSHIWYCDNYIWRNDSCGIVMAMVAMFSHGSHLYFISIVVMFFHKSIVFVLSINYGITNTKNV